MAHSHNSPSTGEAHSTISYNGIGCCSYDNICLHENGIVEKQTSEVVPACGSEEVLNTGGRVRLSGTTAVVD